MELPDMQKLSPPEFLDVVKNVLEDQTEPTWMGYQNPETKAFEFYVRADGVPLQSYISGTPAEMGDRVFVTFFTELTQMINSYQDRLLAKEVAGQ
jgi:hypothetical protein